MDQSTKNILFIGVASVGIYLLWKNYNKKKATTDRTLTIVNDSTKIREGYTPTVKSDIDAFFEQVDVPVIQDQPTRVIAPRETLSEPVVITKNI